MHSAVVPPHRLRKPLQLLLREEVIVIELYLPVLDGQYSILQVQLGERIVCAIRQWSLVLAIKRVEIGSAMRAETPDNERDVVGFEDVVQRRVLLFADEAGVCSEVEQVAHELQVLVFGGVVEGGVAAVVSGVDLLCGELGVEGPQ